MTDKINDFLRETELKKASKGTWGIGTMVTRASAKLVLSLMSVQPATDQILVSAAHVVVLGNEKGGSGKSTAALHVAVALLKAGQRVATIDLDCRQQKFHPLHQQPKRLGAPHRPRP
jgi:Mrp family chromosome partitioning ATPase